MKIKLSKCFPWGMWVLVMVLVGYGDNDNRLKIWGKVDWMVCHSDQKHPHQRLPTAIKELSEPER